MGNISTRILVVFLIATFFVSAFGAITAVNKIGGFKALTGAWASGGTSYASTNITITSQTLINFTEDNITFGSGYVTAGSAACIMDTVGTASAGCSGFASSFNVNLTLENMGNTNVRLNLSNINYTESFIGGSSPGYAIKWNPLESNETTCTNGTAAYIGSIDGGGADFGSNNQWRNISSGMFNSTAAWCLMFNSTDTADSLALSFRVLIPSNALARQLEDVFTATGVAI